MTFDDVISILIVGWFVFLTLCIIHKIGAGGPTNQKQLGAPGTGGPGNDGETGTDTHGHRGTGTHGLSSLSSESTRGSLPDNQEGRHGGRGRGGGATNCGTRAAPHNDPRVTILARSRPYDQDDAAPGTGA